MGSKWKEITLAEVCREVRYGYTAKATEEPTGTRFLRVTDIARNSINWNKVPYCHISEKDFKKYQLLPGDIVIARMGTIGVSAIITQPVRAVAASYLVIHRVDPNIADARFISYVLRSPDWWGFIWSFGSGGAVQPNINARVMGQFRFYLPPLSEQRAIARILGSLDGKIELNRRMNETLEAMAQALFKSWFVDFDPVVVNAIRADNPIPDKFAAKAAHYRDNPNALRLPEDILRLFPDRFVDSELGPIPEGWKIKTLGSICDYPQYGYTASATENPVGTKFLRIKDINKFPWIDWSEVPYCVISEGKKDKYQLQVGDIVIARIADPGHSALIEEPIDAVFASYLIRFRPLNKVYDRYLQYWLRSKPYWNLVEARKSGSTRANLNAKILSAFPLVVPDSRVASIFRLIIGSIRKRIVANINEENVLAALRDTLLPKLISGELRVPDVEKILEDVA